MAFWFFLTGCSCLFPLFMVIFGYVEKHHPPKTINYVYGYRTTRSMRSQQSWDFAQREFGRLWLALSPAAFLIGIVPMLFCLGQSETVVSIVSTVVICIQAIPLLVPIFLIEKKLKQQFDEQGNPR